MKGLAAAMRILLTIFLASTALAQGQTPTITTTEVEWISFVPGSGACGVYTSTEKHIQFTDTAGADWNNLTIRMQMQRGPD